MLNFETPRSPLHVGMGVASPLWPAFAIAASAGAAYWWFSKLTFGQWTPAAVHLEATLPAPTVEEPIVAVELPIEAAPIEAAPIAAEPIELTPSAHEAELETPAEAVEHPVEIAVAAAIEPKTELASAIEPAPVVEPAAPAVEAEPEVAPTAAAPVAKPPRAKAAAAKSAEVVKPATPRAGARRPAPKA